MFGTRLQSLWIMFFLLEWSEKPNAGHNPFETVTIFTFFSSACYLDICLRRFLPKYF